MASTVKEAQPQFVLSDAAGMAATAALREGMRVNGVLPSRIWCICVHACCCLQTKTAMLRCAVLCCCRCV